MTLCQNRPSSHLPLSLSLFSKWVWQVEWAGGSTQHSVCHSHLSQTVFWAVQGNDWAMTEKWLLAPSRFATSEKPRHHLFRWHVQHEPTLPAGPAPLKLWFLSTCTGLHWSTELWSVVLENPTMPTWQHHSKEQSRRLSGCCEGCCCVDVGCSPKVKHKELWLTAAVYWKIVDPWRGGTKSPWKE